MPQVLGKEYRIFDDDNYVNLMPQLIEKEQVPMNMAEVMRATLEGLRDNNRSAQEDFVDKWNDTSDGIAYPGKDSEFSGRFKFVPDSRRLMQISPDVDLVDGALPLSDDDTYAALQGTEFVRVTFENQEFALLADRFKPKEYTKEELYELGATPIGRRLGIGTDNKIGVDEVGNSDLWLAFSHYDFAKSPSDPLNQASRQLRADFCAQVKQIYTDNRGLGIYLGSEQESPTMRAWFAYNVDFWFYAYAFLYLSCTARLAGVRNDA